MNDMNRKFNLVSGKEIENLPSFGVGNLLSDAAGANEVLRNIRNGPALNSIEMERMRGGSGAGPSTMAAPATQDDDKTIHIYVEESNQQELAESATEPIGTTIDHTQLMEEEAEEVKAPVLQARITTDYMRFRYMSEKVPQKKKGGRTRQQYESYGDDDKHVLAEVWINNYVGSAKIVAYCAHEDGQLHPYNLFGESCFYGIYVKKEHIREGKILRLMKVSVTTPKEKEYEQTLKDQLAFLNKSGVDDVKSNKIVLDKQIVYIMFKAILDDGTILSCMSSPIQNKKKGKEFKIEDMEPVSGPVSGDCGTNVQKNRVMICVTEGTNFPADVGVKVREKCNGAVVWEAEPSSDNIVVIKQCVVKFIPPAYKNPRTNVDVEVEICLYDKKTKIETDPVPYIYYPVLDTFGLESKAKKRKLDEDDFSANYSQEDLARSTRKFLSGIRKSPTSAAKRNSSGEQSGSSQENSVQYVEEMSENPADLRSVDPAVLAEATISLLGQKNVQVPFTSYTEGQNVGHSIFGTANAQQPSRPESFGFSSERASSSSRGATPSSSQHPSFLGNQASLVTSTTSVFGSSQQTTSSHTYSSSPAISVGSSSQQLRVPVKVEQQQQAQQQAGNLADNCQFLSDEDMMIFAQQGVSLPKLGPNQSIAVIDGQIYVVNDDINEASTVAPPSSTYQPQPAIIQNIGHQQVIVQQIAPQQPSSEAQRHTMQLSGATSLATQNSGFSAAGSSQNAFRSAPLSSAAAQQQTLLQQQQQQQLQQQLQLLQQLLGPTGIDLALIPLAQQIQLLQQVGNLQNQSSQQQNQESRRSAGTVSYGTNLNDDDVEIDGETYTPGGQDNQIVIQITEETEQRNKKLKSSNTNQRQANLTQKVLVETVPTSGQIPTLVNEDSQDGNIEEESSKRGGKHIDFRYQNGSFGDEASSTEEDDV